MDGSYREAIQFAGRRQLDEGAGEAVASGEWRMASGEWRVVKKKRFYMIKLCG